MTLLDKAIILCAGIGIAFVVIAITEKRYGMEDFEYDENWLGDMTGLREDK